MSDSIAQETFTESHLIICEGKDDQEFFRSFIRNRKMKGLEVIKHAEGNGGFLRRLRSIENSIAPTTKAILLVIDNDSDPKKNFDNVVGQIGKTTSFGKPLYGIPKNRFAPAALQGRPTIGIFSLPGITGTKRGTIETMLLDVFVSTEKFAPMDKCLNKLITCSGVKENWSISKQAKMKLRCFIASTCKDTPECKVSDLWQKKKKFRHLLAHNRFDYIHDFLKKFVTW